MDDQPIIGGTIPHKDTSEMTDTEREKYWQASDDARTLANAEEIKNDPERLKAATDIAGEIAEEKVEEARSMSKVASTLFKEKAEEEN